MFQRIKRLTTILCLCFIITYSTNAKDKSFYDNKDSQLHFKSTSDSINLPVVNWPSHFGVQQTGKINSIFYDNGTFGTGFTSFNGPEPLTLTSTGSFETPSFSGIEYLFGGAIWVGAIVGNDTLVSTSADGWNLGFDEFGGNSAHEPTMEKINFPSDYSLRAEFMDTFTVEIQNDIISGQPHTPLNIRIANRSHIWRKDTLDNAIYYDYVLDYVGPEDKLDSVYVGFYFDGDVGLAGTNNYFSDDAVGSIQNKGIGYIIDADGDPTAGSFDENSPQKVFAFELITSSFVPTDTNFNWWISGVDNNDYGPRLKGTPEDPYRNFGTGGTGTPVGDANKYYIMSHKEWDYDIVNWKFIDTSLWRDLLSVTLDFSSGTDVRFLYSIGPITLEKGKPERIIVSTFTADSVHVDPTNVVNIPDNPSQYNANLNLENIIAVGDRIRLHVDSFLDPLNPPTGLVVYDNNKIRFDPYCFEDVTGHELYATPIDPSSFPFPGAVPPWYIPPFPNHIGTSIFEIPMNYMEGITAINIAYKSAQGTSEISGTRFINYENNAVPTIQPVTTTTTADSIVLEWTIPANSTQPEFYKIYKYATLSEFYHIYTKPFYSQGFDSSFTSDSIEVDGAMWYYQSAQAPPYAQVDGSSNQFIDYNFDEDYYYFILSVDSNGFESRFRTVKGYLVPERTKDLLIVINNDIAPNSTSKDSIINYYHFLLSGTEFEYDIYNVLDSTGVVDCTDPDHCPDWKFMSAYKYVIIDESEYSSHEWFYEIIEYLNYGGNIINFACFSQFTNINITTDPGWYLLNGYTSQYFGVDSIFSYGHYYNYPDPIEENKFGFNVAKSVDGMYTSLECDTILYPLDLNWLSILNTIPTNEPLQVTALKPTDSSVVTHTYQSLYPSTSYMQGLPVGIKKSFNNIYYSNEVYTFGFHLYYMKQNQARDLLRSIIFKIPTDVENLNLDNLPSEFSLSQNYPNPFNPTTTIQFYLPKRSDVTLNIYNLLGQKVTQLVDKEYPAGNYKVTWDGTNNTGDKVSSGIYLYRFETDDFKSTKKMVLLK